MNLTATVTAASAATGSSGSTASLTTGSITPVSGQLYLLYILSKRAGASNTPTVTGTNGLNVTWTAVANQQDAGNTMKVSCLRGIAASGVAGTLTIAFAAQTQTDVVWTLVTFVPVLTTTNQGVRQNAVSTAAAATASAVSLTTGQTSNAAIILYGAGSSANTTFTPAAGMTAIVTQADSHGTLGMSWMQGKRSGSTWTFPNMAPTGTLGASGTIDAIGLEIDAYIEDMTPVASANRAALGTGFRSQSGDGRYRGVLQLGTYVPAVLAYGGGGPSGTVTGDAGGQQSVSIPAVSSFGYWPLRSQRDDVTGNPIPAQKQFHRSILKNFVIPGHVGSNRILVDVKFERGVSPFPYVTVKAAQELGLFADVIVTAVSPGAVDPGSIGFRLGGYAWQVLTIDFTLAVVGIVELWRTKTTDGDDLVWWDNFRRSS